MSAFKFTHAIVSRVPNSYETGCSRSNRYPGDIDIEKAKKQHEAYCDALRSIGIDVIELPADENHPDSVFVEDTAVVCNGTALICRPGSPKRRKEVDTIRSILRKELDMPIVEIKDDSATLDGGDVLFTGKEFFVGLSERTNEAGAKAVAAAFPEFPVTPIKVTADLLHIKTACTMAGPGIISVGSSKEAQEILKRIEREATYRYKTLTVPNDWSANCVYANGFLLHSVEDDPSAKIFEEKVEFDRKPLYSSEFHKADAGLACLSILIGKFKHIRKL